MTVPELFRTSPAGTLAHLLPVITPSPAASSPGQAQRGARGSGEALLTAAEWSGSGLRMIFLALATAAALAVTAALMTVTGKIRKRRTP